MVTRVTSILLLIVFWSLHAYGQKREHKFTRINTQDEGSIGQVNFITEDKNGYIWISEETGSLIRYDGDNIKRYQHDPQDPNSLGGTYPECLMIDKEGMIWIGFFDAGVDRFDPVTETFTHFRHNPDNENSIPHDMVSAIIQDAEGNIYIGTLGGLTILDPSTMEFANYKHDPNVSTTISSNSVRELYEDKLGNIWIGTGWFNDSYDKGGLNRFDKNTDTFTRYMADHGNPTAIQSNFISAIYEDSRHNFWIGTRDNYLYNLDRESGEFHQFTYDPLNPNKLYSIAELGNNIGYGITFIQEDSEQNLWIGIGDSGFLVYHPEDNTLTRFGNNYDAFGTFIEGTSWCMHAGSNGLLWISTQPGIYQVDPYSFIIPRVNEGLPAYAKESDSIYWSGFSNKLVRISSSDSLFLTVSFDEERGQNLQLDTITTLLLDSENILWIGTLNGLHHADLKHDPFKIKKIKADKMQLGGISALYEDDAGIIWIGTRRGQGLFRYDREAGEFSRSLHNIDGFPFRILDIEGGFKDELWIGLNNIGSIERYNTLTKQLDDYTLGNGVNQIFKDHSETVWVSAPSGFFRYDSIKNTFATISNYPMHGILEDDHHNIWISSLTDIFRLNSSRDGLIKYPGEYVARSGYMNTYGSGGYMITDGTIFLGDEKDYFTFNPDKIAVPPDSSRLYFTRLWIGDDLVVENVEKVHIPDFIEDNGITLTNDQNTFSLAFTELDFRNPGRNRISYLLKGYDLDWRQSFTEEKVTYFNVSPGQYDFQIKAVNSATGQWSFKSINMIILPPWWATWWAYSLYALLLVLGVWFIHRYQKARVIRAEREKAQKIELAQAREIEKAYSELKATQEQLIHSEKMASLGELTAGIAHEIQNPLNFVNNFSEVSAELVEEMNQELDNGDIPEAKAIASDLKQNLEKINHHGKRADSIVKGMLQHSRGSEGKKESTDINKLADEYLRLSYHGLRARDKSFNAAMETDLDPKAGNIDIVPQDMGRVILNLVTNAFHAVTEKAQQAKSDFKPTVTLKTRKTSQGVEIEVTDNGMGIPEKLRSKIFQPFFTTRPSGKGTGLGLSMSYEIVTKGHGGELTMSSEEGKGTTFRVVLPQ